MATAKKPATPKKPPVKKPTGKGSRPATANTKAHLAKVRPVLVMLQLEHNINGRSYGPGEVRVKPNLARALMEAEQRAAFSEQRAWENRAHMISKSGDGRYAHVRIAAENFDTYMSNTPSGLVIQL